jgi:hypothetical protein
MNELFTDRLEERMLDQHTATIVSKSPARDAFGPMVLAARLDSGSGSDNGSNNDSGAPARISQPDDGRPTKLQVERTNPKTWLLHFPEGVVRIGSPALADWGRIQTAHVEQLERSPRWMPGRGDPWPGANGLHAWLESQMTDEDHLEAPPELTVVGETLSFLARFVGEQPDEGEEGSIEAVAQGGAWWDREGGRICFKLKSVYTNYSRTVPAGDRLSMAQMRQGIEALGGRVSVNQRISGDVMPRISWVPISAFF